MRKNVVLAILMCLPFAFWGGGRIVANISFDRAIEGHLKRAGDANSVELAMQELDVALKNMEQRGYTTGYTSIFYQTPDEDIGFWYTNVKSCSTQLHELPVTASAETKNMVLMKLRQTLLDHTANGETVTHPDGITVYPNNMLWMIACIFSLLMVVGAFIVLIS